jgi:hypothetical protein
MAAQAGPHLELHGPKLGNDGIPAQQEARLLHKSLAARLGQTTPAGNTPSMLKEILLWRGSERPRQPDERPEASIDILQR